MYFTTFCPKKDNFSQNFTFTNLGKVFSSYCFQFLVLLNFIYNQHFLFSSILAILYIFVINNAFKPLKCRSLLIIFYIFLGNLTKTPRNKKRVCCHGPPAQQNVLILINQGSLKKVEHFLHSGLTTSPYFPEIVTKTQFVPKILDFLENIFYSP